MSSYKNESKILIIKRLLILFAVILLIFGIINAIWYFGYRQRYNGFTKNLEVTYLFEEDDDEMMRYTKEIGDYIVSMKMPEYLGLGGFVSIAPTAGYTVSEDDEGNIIESSEMYVTLYIWPKFFIDYKIGLDFYDEANLIWEQVELTSDMELMNTDNYDDAYVEYILQLMSDHQDEINEMIHIASENMGIGIAQI